MHTWEEEEEEEEEEENLGFKNKSKTRDTITKAIYSQKMSWNKFRVLKKKLTWEEEEKLAFKDKSKLEMK